MSIEDRPIQRQVTSILLVLSCLIVGVFIFLTVVQNTNYRSNSEVAYVKLNVDHKDQSESSLRYNSTSSEQLLEPEVPIKPLHSDIVAYCPDPRVEPSQVCWDYLDKFLLDISEGHQRSHWIKHSEDVTYRQIFEDPMRDRQLVIDTLDNPECMLTNKTDFRWNLTEKCRASAFVNFHQFQLKCGHPTSYSWRTSSWFFPLYEQNNGTWISKFDSRLSAIEHTFEHDKERRKQNLWEEVLETRWIVKQCEGFDVEKILIDYERDATIIDRLQEVGRNLGVRWSNFEDGYRIIPITNSLIAIAAYFGETNSIISYDGHREWFAYRDEKHPWIRTNYDLFASKNTRDEKLSKGIQTVIELEDSGIDYDLKLLVQHICTDQTTLDPDTCQTTINNLRTRLRPNEWRQQQVLDRIERIALESGIYYGTSDDKPVRNDRIEQE